jgi:hypothetical protein
MKTFLSNAVSLCAGRVSFLLLFALISGSTVPRTWAATTPSVPTVPLPKHTWGRGAEDGSDCAGEVDDGELGAAAMQLNRGGAHARKAWFFLGDSVLCIGAELRAYDLTLRLVTGVNQCWARGPARVSGRDAVLAAGNPTQLGRTRNLTLEIPGSPVHLTSFDFPQAPTLVNRC